MTRIGPTTDTLGDLMTATDGKLHGSQSAAQAALLPVGPVVTDSRQVSRGAVFWALKGPFRDGADFAADAFQRGAAGVVSQQPLRPPSQCWALQVDNAQEALHRWAAWKRRRFSGTLIAVTGSVGKTTTRQMIHTVLRTRLSGTASPSNYNNHIGLPLSMCGLHADQDYAVLELGANRRGEIAALAELCRPKVGVITQLGDAHLGGFGSRQAIAETKAELLAALPPDGRAILGEDPWLWRLARRCTAAVTWVGCSADCDIRATDIRSHCGQLSFHVYLGSADSTRGCRFCVPVWGRHHVTCALAAVAVGRALGLDLEEIADALEDFQPVPMRCEVVQIRGATIVNDAYNASPTAMQAALELLRDFDPPGRRIVVVGDMAELGREAVAQHWRLGRQVVTRGAAQWLIACGRFAPHVVAGARAAGMPRARAIPCRSVEQALPYLARVVLPGDVVLVKGSRKMAMEQVLEALSRDPQRRSA